MLVLTFWGGFFVSVSPAFRLFAWRLNLDQEDAMCVTRFYLPDNAVLLLEGWTPDDGMTSMPGDAAALENMRSLLDAWRAGRRPLIHLQGARKSGIANLANPGEPVLRCASACPFEGADLKRVLRREGLNCLVWVGAFTASSLATTMGKAYMFGFEAYVVPDAILGAPFATGIDAAVLTTNETLDALAREHEPSRSSGAS